MSRKKLTKLIPKSGRSFTGFTSTTWGCGWRHEIVFEGFPAADPKVKYPLCVEGARASPPEDCGGAWRYADYSVGLGAS